MQPLLSIENLSVDFVSDSGTTRAVNNISLAVNRGEIVAIVGESGSGKSVTSLSILQLLPSPPARYSEGKIIFTDAGHSTDLLRLSSKEIRTIRGARIATIFQEPMTSLNPVMKCGEQVVEALLVHKRLSRKEAKRQTLAWFEKVKLPNPATLFDRYPHQLSGGQKQRVMIAMAMSCHPQLLICDEPTTALDVTVQKTILQLIKDLQQAQNMGVIFITHDLGVVAEIADRVVIMYKGGVVEEGLAQTIFTSAKHPYTKALIACRPARHPKGERLPTVGDYAEPETTGKEMKAADGERRTTQAVSEKKEVLVQVQNLTVRFPNKPSLFGKPLSFFTAVNDVSFEIYKNETLGLVGESGCGKTTLGRTLLRLVEPSGGSIAYNGTDITRLSLQPLKALRKNVQLVFQDPYSSLNPRLTVETALSEPMKVAGIGSSAKDRRKKVAALLHQVNMPSSAMARYPHEFSGGQRQRIVIARALGLQPDFLVCDESVSALDVSVQAQVLNLLNDIKKELGLTLLFISHDLSVVRYMCDRVLVMQAGVIVESGAAEEIYCRPKSEYTAKLLAAIPKMEAVNGESSMRNGRNIRP